MKKFVRFVSIFICCVMLRSTALACEVNVGTASTSVYVRSASSGEIVGSLEKNDKVTVNSISGGWANVTIGDKNYKIWSEYLNYSTETEDEVNFVNKPKASKSQNKKNSSPIKNCKESKISGDFFSERD